MNFNHPFHPLYNQFMQGIYSINPWLINNSIQYSHINYPQHYGFPFHQNALQNPFLIQQNNFYGSNITCNTQQRSTKQFNERSPTAKKSYSPNQTRTIEVQIEINKRNNQNKNKSRIAEIIEIEDSNQAIKTIVQQNQNQKNVYFNNSKQNNPKLDHSKKSHNAVESPSNKTINRLYSAVTENKEKKQFKIQNQQINEGTVRRSKRNSAKYIKKIKKIIRYQMIVNKSPSKPNLQAAEKIKQQGQNFEDKFQEIAYQRAVIPSFQSFQASWKVLKKDDLLARTLN